MSRRLREFLDEEAFPLSQQSAHSIRDQRRSENRTSKKVEGAEAARQKKAEAERAVNEADQSVRRKSAQQVFNVQATVLVYSDPNSPRHDEAASIAASVLPAIETKIPVIHSARRRPGVEVSASIVTFEADLPPEIRVLFDSVEQR